jgi:hypothetical protein
MPNDTPITPNPVDVGFERIRQAHACVTVLLGSINDRQMDEGTYSADIEANLAFAAQTLLDQAREAFMAAGGRREARHAP